ncbi:MAG: cell surface protein [Deltaproteobacteria bacterium]|nr:MAG: cell surface protein [Deltaproteobacteria bacterium]
MESDPFADCVARFEPAAGVSFGHDALPDVVLGPPVGGGAAGGGMDVASLGCGGRIVLAFDGEGIVDGPGPDFIVFENPFVIGEGPETFTEPGEVAVSADGRTFHTFPCTPSGDGTFPPEGCAGVTPVFAGPDAPQIDPTDPTAAGGDAFDLADVGLSSARYVRIVDRTAEHYGDETWCGGAAGGFDLDAIASVHATEQP